MTVKTYQMKILAALLFCLALPVAAATLEGRVVGVTDARVYDDVRAATLTDRPFPTHSGRSLPKQKPRRSGVDVSAARYAASFLRRPTQPSNPSPRPIIA